MADVTCIVDGPGFPEGPILLKDGSLFVVEIQNEQLRQIEPAGNLIGWVDLETLGLAITNIAFGGEDMRDACLTASATGCVDHMRWPRSGLRLH